MGTCTEYLDIKVTSINGRFHARLLNTDTGKVLDEMACTLRCDIGFICNYMLRWHDKLGGTSPMAQASRDRNKFRCPEGKIIYNAGKEQLN